MNMHAPIRANGAAEAAGEGQGFAARNRRVLIIAALVAIAAVWAAFKFMGGEPEAAPQEAKAPRVSVIVPGRVAVAAEVRVTGTVEARREMPVGVQGEGGMVTSVLVEAGDFVRAGQVMARVDRAVQAQQVAQLRASVQQARADLALAQSELDRASQLVEKGFISKADIDRRTATRDSNAARVRVVAAQLAEAQARLARLDIRAPDSGLVLARAVEPGQIVGPGGSPLFRIAKDGAMEMKARVAEQDLTRLRVGMPATVQLVGNPRQFSGEIWLLEPVIDPQSRQGAARIALTRDPDLRVGAFANGRIAAGTAEQPLLPQSAVLADTRGSYVYVVGGDNKIVRREVRTGEISEAGIAIAAGLTGSERVVLSAGAFLNEGEKIDPVLQRDR
jgi:RND family efflux transporter MFP subunit